MRHGWFAIPGIQTGDRTLEEQFTGCHLAVREARGKTVLDLGCAEGLISREFARAGGIVLGIEKSWEKVEMAHQVCGSSCDFVCADIGDWLPQQEAALVAGIAERFDIVLCLSIITKLPDPAMPLRHGARLCADLLLLRTSAAPCDGVFYAKHGGKACNVIDVLSSEGFRSEAKFPSSHGEAVEYWRRTEPVSRTHENMCSA